MRIFPENSNVKTTGQRVKFGIDPTFPRLHLGHLVPLLQVRKLLEHNEVTIVLGTFTAQLGDPSGRDKTRPILPAKEVEANAEKILEQVKRILKKPFKVFANGDVFNQMRVPALMAEVSKFTLQQFLVKDAFNERFENNNSIGLHELLVPILQGLDSVNLKTTIEIGGQDQLFNFQVARRLQEIHNQEPQICMLMPIIVGTDGRKMSKSLNNCIFLDEQPNDIFGKVMSISDETMAEWWPLFVEDETQATHPMERKKFLAFQIIKILWDERSAINAMAHFVQTVQMGAIPQQVKLIQAETLLDAVCKVRNLSRTAGRRLIDEGAVRINGQPNKDAFLPLKSEQVVQIGRRDFAKIK